MVELSQSILNKQLNFSNIAIEYTTKYFFRLIVPLKSGKPLQTVFAQVMKPNSKMFYPSCMSGARRAMTDEKKIIAVNLVTQSLKGSVSQDFRSPVFVMIRTHLGP